MSKFDLKQIDSIKGIQKFYQLTIDDKPDYSNLAEGETKNDRKTGVLDKYKTQLQSKYLKDLVSIYAYMERVANNEPVPGIKYHILERPKSDPYVDFEFKKGDLRVYGIQTPDGKVIVLGGYKNDQPADIRRLRSLKEQYFKSINKT